MVDHTTLQHASVVMASLGHEVRLSLYRTLVRAGPEGMSFHRMVEAADVPPSTLTHHLKMLVAAGLVTQERRGRETITKPVFETLDEVIAFLNAECCQGFAEDP